MEFFYRNKVNYVMDKKTATSMYEKYAVIGDDRIDTDSPTYEDDAIAYLCKNEIVQKVVAGFRLVSDVVNGGWRDEMVAGYPTRAEAIKASQGRGSGDIAGGFVLVNGKKREVYFALPKWARKNICFKPCIFNWYFAATDLDILYSDGWIE